MFLNLIFPHFPQSMKMSRRTQQAESIFHVVPAVPSLLQSPDHLLSMDTAGRLHVSEEIRKVHLLCLRQNLCTAHFYLSIFFYNFI
jgi:hypothetical protein